MDPFQETAEGTKTVLLVDDDEELRSTLKDVLELAGYRVIASCGYAEALKAGKADIAIIDYQMPDGDGIGLMERLRETIPGLPVILMTGFGSEYIVAKAFRPGAADYIKKPFNIYFLPAFARPRNP